jgi:hypothetical protein
MNSSMCIAPGIGECFIAAAAVPGKAGDLPSALDQTLAKLVHVDGADDTIREQVVVKDVKPTVCFS